jgi:acetoacetate decarboxylase
VVRQLGPAAREEVRLSAYPPAPWRIAGPAAIVPVLIPLAIARRHVPGDVEVVAVAPGRTAGGLLVARYEPGSTLAYGELLVFPALTRVRGSLGMWISHAYVDSPASLAGGRRMWGVPKDLATFAWRPGGVTITREDGTPLLGAAWRTPRRTLPLPGSTRSNGTVGGVDRRAFAGGGRLTMGPARVDVDVPAASPFAALGLAGRRPSLAGHADFRLRAPRVLT